MQILGKKLGSEKFESKKTIDLLMEMFNVNRRDILDFDNYMNLKNPGFGGPASAIPFRDRSGNKVNRDPKLSEYQRVVERDPAFSHPVYNSTYKAMTHDLVYKQEKKKPFTYKDPYITALPVVQVGVMQESRAFITFSDFLTEAEASAEKQERLKMKLGLPDEARIFDLRTPTYLLRDKENISKSAVDREKFSQAEEFLLDELIKYDEIETGTFNVGKREVTGRAFIDDDGAIVAYVDLDANKLIIMPNAEKMSSSEYQRIQDPDVMGGSDDDMNDMSDLEDSEDVDDSDEIKYYRSETEFEQPEETAVEPSYSPEEVESLLKSFEIEEEDEEVIGDPIKEEPEDDLTSFDEDEE